MSENNQIDISDSQASQISKDEDPDYQEKRKRKYFYHQRKRTYCCECLYTI